MRCGEGHSIPADAPEQLCPRCLLELVTPPTLPPRIGPYQVLELLGEGGFGRVYRARKGADGDIVAVKVLRHLEFADQATILQFRKEPTLSAKLSARYVVPVLDTGEHEGLPYFVMEFMPGGTLRERSHEYRDSPQRAAELVIQMAEAVQYLHCDPERPEREPILHRDLKPENVLFGADGRPRISDFGIAKLAKGSRWTAGTRTIGCPAYMAPEQAYPTAHRELTAAADVYALGAILYELFTGRPPFEGTDAEILAQLKEDEPLAPRRLAPGLDRFLEAVVLDALEKDPASRYHSAEGFAQDLERALLKKAPEQAPAVPLVTRVRARIRRRPLAWATGAWALSLASVVGISAYSTLSARAERLDRDQQTNAAVAGMQAVAVNLQLRAYEHHIAELAQDPTIVALLDQALPTGFSPILQRRLSTFDTMFVLGTDGRPGARTSPKSAEYLARSFEFRDYFRGARRLGLEACRGGDGSPPAAEKRRAHLARAFTSEADGHFEFAISAPLCRGNEWVGIVAGTIATDKVLGAVRVLDDRNSRIAAVLGPRDRDRADAGRPLPSDITFIVHPGLARGQTQRLHQPAPTVLRAALGISAQGDADADAGKLRYAAPLRVDDYRDPIAGFEGAWSAVFAAADASGYVVADQSRRDGSPLAHVLFRDLALPAGVPFGIGLATLVCVALARRRPAVRRATLRAGRAW
jgi:eukaryotic-like serine/threonine-protein kinase